MPLSLAQRAADVIVVKKVTTVLEAESNTRDTC